MNYFKHFCIIIGVVLLGIVDVSAAHIYMQAPANASQKRQPFVVFVFLDNENKTVSGISGTFSFPEALFDVGSISTQSSVVSMWAQQPKISTEKYFDGQTHIHFEGIMPGGFEGVRSPYYKGTLPGVLFSVTLIPKAPGIGTLLLDELEVHAYDPNASLLPVTGDSSTVAVPQLVGTYRAMDAPQHIKNTSLLTTLSQSELVNNGAWYLTVTNQDVNSTIDTIYVAESDESNPELISDYDWQNVTPPYVLLFQSRNKFIHVKVVYSNNTYTYQTIPPVDNSAPISFLSRILIGVILAVLFLYHYGKEIEHFFSKKNKTTT